MKGGREDFLCVLIFRWNEYAWAWGGVFSMDRAWTYHENIVLVIFFSFFFFLHFLRLCATLRVMTVVVVVVCKGKINVGGFRCVDCVFEARGRRGVMGSEVDCSLKMGA